MLRVRFFLWSGELGVLLILAYPLATTGFAWLGLGFGGFSIVVLYPLCVLWVVYGFLWWLVYEGRLYAGRFLQLMYGRFRFVPAGVLVIASHGFMALVILIPALLYPAPLVVYSIVVVISFMSERGEEKFLRRLALIGKGVLWGLLACGVFLVGIRAPAYVLSLSQAGRVILSPRGVLFRWAILTGVSVECLGKMFLPWQSSVSSGSDSGSI